MGLKIKEIVRPCNRRIVKILEIPKEALKTLAFSDGSKETMQSAGSNFSAIGGICLIEWSTGECEMVTKYWLDTYTEKSK